jgi:amino acid transporter
MVAVALTFGRMVFAAARDEAWPAPLNRLFVRLSPRFGSPAIATLTLGLLALPLCLVPIRVLILINGNINIAVYGTLSLAVLAGRRSGATAHGVFRAPWHPAAPVIVITAMAALALADLLDPETGRPALLATGVIVAAGMLYAALVTRRNPHWRHRDAPHGAPVPAGDD